VIDLGADAGEWYSALFAVQELHKPVAEGVEPNATQFCGECSHAWPCATMRVIADAVFFDFDTEQEGSGG
jgi:hypothetical protein